MRRFCSYGPIDTGLHYYVPRQELVDRACAQLVGDDPVRGGHYVTVWAPRQTGKTWVMQQVVKRLKARDDFEVAILTMQSTKGLTATADVLDVLITGLEQWFGRPFPRIAAWKDLRLLFAPPYFTRPLILVLDEFDALDEAFINQFANEFRAMYTQRVNEADRPSGAKSCLLHGLALIGVRSVLGIENISGSPFNVQRSLHVPNLTADEVTAMFHWYERESGQPVDLAVIDRLFDETRGQPGLVSWLGELLTETFNRQPAQPLTMAHFEEMYGAALNVLPNNNILNLVSKARQSPYREVVLEMFRTGEPLPFRYDDQRLNFLYMHGVVDWERVAQDEYYVRFPCPLVQKRLFNYFAYDLFGQMGYVHQPFADLSDTIGDESLNVKNLLRRYEQYLRDNRTWLLKDAPRRSDLRIYEAVYHFSLFAYLERFLHPYKGRITPEFPTGNGKVDLLLAHAGRRYAVEVKSFASQPAYRAALRQAGQYARQLGLSEITLALFVEAVDDANRTKYEAAYADAATGVTVMPVLVVTGES